MGAISGFGVAFGQFNSDTREPSIAGELQPDCDLLNYRQRGGHVSGIPDRRHDAARSVAR